MITRVTIRCDWPGCKAILEYECGPLHPTEAGWKTEKPDSAYSMHLCPAHNRKRWSDVRVASVGEHDAPDTGHFSSRR